MYLISTKFGMIPNILDDSTVLLNKDRILFIDDFIFKDSVFFSKNVSLRTFCGIKENIKIYLIFKTGKLRKSGKTRTLVNKRGYYKINKDDYMKFIKILNPNFYQDFKTDDCVLDNEGNKIIIQDFKNIDEFNTLKSYSFLFGTSFINDLVEENKMLKICNNKLVVAEEVFDCKCCGNLSDGYLQHLKDMKEINLLYYLTIHNYNTLDNFISKHR